MSDHLKLDPDAPDKDNVNVIKDWFDSKLLRFNHENVFDGLLSTGLYLVEGTYDTVQTH